MNILLIFRFAQSLFCVYLLIFFKLMTYSYSKSASRRDNNRESFSQIFNLQLNINVNILTFNSLKEIRYLLNFKVFISVFQKMLYMYHRLILFQPTFQDINFPLKA